MSSTLLGVLALWALVMPAVAQVYKWVDDKGATHYGERPPQDKKAEELKRGATSPEPAPGTAVQPNWQERDLEFKRRRIEAEQAEAVAKQREASQKQACYQARDQLARMKSAGRLYRLDGKGERVYESEGERNASIARMEQLAAERCR